MPNVMPNIWGNTHTQKSILKLRSDRTVCLGLPSWLKPSETASHKEKCLCSHRQLQQSKTVTSSRAWLSLAQRGQQRTPHFNMCSRRLKSVRSKCSHNPYLLYPPPPKWVCKGREMANRSHVMMISATEGCLEACGSTVDASDHISLLTETMALCHITVPIQIKYKYSFSPRMKQISPNL